MMRQRDGLISLESLNVWEHKFGNTKWNLLLTIILKYGKSTTH